TGRELDDLLAVFPEIEIFVWVVAENGALLYRPGSPEPRLLASAPPESFVKALRERGIAPLSVGRVIVATREPNETPVLETIRDEGLELGVIFNKGAVMVLPYGVNKATGLAAALAEMVLSPHNVIGIGDAENDHAFLDLCECSAAVANALPALQKRVDLITRESRGAGVAELADRLVATDLEELAPRLTRHSILLGSREDGRKVELKTHGEALLLAGWSGSGKSTTTAGIVERVSEAGYQFCLVDPEGDHENLAGSVSLGDANRAPSLEEALALLEDPTRNLTINLLGVPMEDRPAFFQSLVFRLEELRARTGRPHWLMVDEAHHLLPASREPAHEPAAGPWGLILITLDPGRISPRALAPIRVALALGDSPGDTLGSLAEALGVPHPEVGKVSLKPKEALAWYRDGEEPPFRMTCAPPASERKRHHRKYAEGDLGEDRSFYFRGPEGKLNLRAQNLIFFLQLAEGVDDETWNHHLHAGDYSEWFREGIKDEGLAEEAMATEGDRNLTPDESRSRIRQAVESRYTAPS
ncbi:MAG: HAD hydrolase family protein, partial [Actinomycetota bacterium]